MILLKLCAFLFISTKINLNINLILANYIVAILSKMMYNINNKSAGRLHCLEIYFGG